MSPVTVLVVEDESVVALDIQQRLTAMGYAVAGVAFTGPEAIQIAHSRRPDIALMDIRLKGPLSGIDAAERLHAELDLPVVYLTAYADQATLERARVSEPFGYILKPFEDRELNITIKIALYRHAIEKKLRESETQLRAAHQELEQRVAERTAELTRVNEQLRLEIAARERAQMERNTAQEGRRRLAQEIHDSVAQSIFSLILTSQAARSEAMNGNSRPAVQTLLELEEIARQALKELRLLLFQLRSPLLDHEGLVAALRHRLEAVESRVGVATRLLAPPALDISPVAEEGAYRVAMEALNNSLKHARATEVVVELGLEGDDLVLAVTDNGIGFDEHTMTQSGGLGLAGMYERAERIGGRLLVDSEPDRGTRVTMHVARFAADSDDKLR